MKNADKPAYPFAADHKLFGNDGNLFYPGGLTKRELFAYGAMKAILGNKAMIDTGDDNALTWVAQTAIRQADIFLSELEKTESK